MDDEKIFEIVNNGIKRAVELLEKGAPLAPFAITLESDDTLHTLLLDERDHEHLYTLLLETLRAEAAGGTVRAAALLARVTIPEHFSPAVAEGIRIHIEERAASQSGATAARLLYIPYQLYRAEGEEQIRVHLHHPIPIGFPPEIFV